MPHVAAGDLSMHYEEHGRPDGPPLVLLHAFTQTGAVWRAQAGAFGARFRLLAPDWRGHGRTANPGGLAAMNHRQFARDIIAFCRALGVGRAAFCGASSGGMLLLTLALAAPDLVAALVLSGVTYHLSDEGRARNARLTPDDFLRGTGDPAELVTRHSPQGPDAWRAVVAAFIAVGTHAHGEDFPEPEELRGIAAPTLIVHGDRDPYFPVAVPVALHGLLSDAELCILPATGHMPSAERPDWFNPIVLDFLDRRLDGAGKA